MNIRKLFKSEKGASAIEYAMLLSILGSCVFSVPTVITNPARATLLRAIPGSGDSDFRILGGGSLNNSQGGGSMTSNSSNTGGLGPHDGKDDGSAGDGQNDASTGGGTNGKGGRNSGSAPK